MINIKMTDKNGVVLSTAGKIVCEDINVNIDDTSSENLVSENIKQGVTILGVEGSVVASNGIDYLKYWAGGRDNLNNPIDLYSESVEKIGNYAFQLNKNIKSVDFPNATSIGNYAFSGCSNLTSINAPNVTTIGTSGSNENRVFASCSLLKSIQFDLIEKIGEYCFSSCAALKYAKFAMVNTIYSYGFGGLTSTQGISNADLYFGYEDVVVLKDSYVFDYAKNVRVHVRPGLDLATEYASATNWSSLIAAGTITIVEDYTDD